MEARHFVRRCSFPPNLFRKVQVGHSFPTLFRMPTSSPRSRIPVADLCSHFKPAHFATTFPPSTQDGRPPNIFLVYPTPWKQSDKARPGSRHCIDPAANEEQTIPRIATLGCRTGYRICRKSTHLLIHVSPLVAFISNAKDSEKSHGHSHARLVRLGAVK